MKKIIWGIALLFSTSMAAGAHTCCHNSAQKCGCKRGYYTQYYGDKPELIKEAIAWTESGIWRNGFDTIPMRQMNPSITMMILNPKTPTMVAATFLKNCFIIMPIFKL